MSNTVNLELDINAFEMLIHQANEAASVLETKSFGFSPRTIGSESWKEDAIQWFSDNYQITLTTIGMISSALYIVSEALVNEAIKIVPGDSENSF